MESMTIETSPFPLPAVLEPWRVWLSWFSPDVLPVVCELLQRLQPLLGDWCGDHSSDMTEINGLGNIQQRGNYERLLMSEWLLAEEFPEEFLRRAANAEQLFLTPEYHSQQLARQLVVLVDSGVLQLGACRLVHIAMLILLARRAESVQGVLYWGVLQVPGVLHSCSSVTDLMKLIHSRSKSEVNAEHYQIWFNYLESENFLTVGGECWLIGSAFSTLKSVHPAVTHTLSIKPQLIAPGLEVELYAAQQTRQIVLPIPDVRQASLLLQGKFQQTSWLSDSTTSFDQQIDENYPPIMGPRGNFVIAVLADKTKPGLLIGRWSRKSQTTEIKWSKQYWCAREQLVAITVFNKTIGAVLADSLHWRFWSMSAFDSLISITDDKPAWTAQGVLASIWLKFGGISECYLLDSDRRLLCWQATSSVDAVITSKTMQIIALQVLQCIAINHEQICYASRIEQQLVIHHWNRAAHTRRRYALGQFPQDITVLFSASRVWDHQFGICVVYCQDETRCWLFTPEEVQTEAVFAQCKEIIIPEEWQVIGIQYDGLLRESSLLLINQQQTHFALYTGHQLKVLYQVLSPVKQYTFCPNNGLLTLVTSNQELIVYSVAEQQVKIHCSYHSEE